MTNFGAMGTPGVWQVTAQDETVELGPNQTVVNGVNVSFLTGTGVHGTVFVPREMYSAQFVRDMIAAKVVEIDAIASLTHES